MNPWELLKAIFFIGIGICIQFYLPQSANTLNFLHSRYVQYQYDQAAKASEYHAAHPSIYPTVTITP